jgi:repressor LexA
MPLKLFNRHFAILRFLREFRAEHGYSPSIREIGAGVEINSTFLIRYYLDGLVEARLITRNPRIARSVILTEKGTAESYRECRQGQTIRISLFLEE